MKENLTIYFILCTTNNKYYVGMDSYWPLRKKSHLRYLKKNKHQNNHLQAAWNKYAEESFKFGILEQCSSYEDLIKKETYWIGRLNSYEEGFNQTIGGEGCRGYKQTEEHKAKVINSNRGKKRSEEIKKEISRRLRGEKSYKAILTDAQALEIREYIKENNKKHGDLRKLCVELAEKYGVARNTIQGVYYRTHFKHI